MSEPKRRKWTWFPFDGTMWWGIDWGGGVDPEQIARHEALQKDREEEQRLERAFKAAHPHLF